MRCCRVFTLSNDVVRVATEVSTNAGHHHLRPPFHQLQQRMVRIYSLRTREAIVEDGVNVLNVQRFRN